MTIPKTIAFLARKGGVGKSTLAMHLAVLAQEQGRRPLLIDTDPQGTITAWFRRREQETPTVLQCDVREAQAYLQRAGEQGFDLAIIDTRASLETDATVIAGIADWSIIPTRPAFADLESVHHTAAALVGRGVGARAAFLLNFCSPGRGATEAAETGEARRRLAQYELLPAMHTSIVDRKPLRRALGAGEAVTEFDPESRAADEIRALWLEVSKQLFPEARERAPRRRPRAA